MPLWCLIGRLTLLRLEVRRKSTAADSLHFARKLLHAYFGPETSTARPRQPWESPGLQIRGLAGAPLRWAIAQVCRESGCSVSDRQVKKLPRPVSPVSRIAALRIAA